MGCNLTEEELEINEDIIIQKIINKQITKLTHAEKLHIMKDPYKYSKCIMPLSGKLLRNEDFHLSYRKHRDETLGNRLLNKIRTFEYM